MAPRSSSDLLDVDGVQVGHATAPSGATGVTVVVLATGAPAVVDVRGGASGTYDTASLGLDATFGRRWALFVSGGSLFGLDAARGIRSTLLRDGHGVRAFGHRRRLAPLSGAVIFDLPADDRPLPDYAELGRRATEAAGRGPLAHGRVGAGAGATVGKYLGRPAAMPGGVGSAARALGNGRSVGVLSVVNAAGAIRDPSTGRWLAGAMGPRGRIVPPSEGPLGALPGRGTTVSIVVTDLPLSRPQLARVAAITHAGIGRTVVPYLTAVDGDVVFAATTSAGRPAPERQPGSSADRVGRWAADAAVDAVLTAVRTDLHQLPRPARGPRR